MTGTETYDAVVVGASFAGLSAAGQLAGAGRVLLVDREPIGAGETSACGTLLAVLERLDAADALEQVHPEVVINVGGRRVAFDTAYPFATFDYRTLCEILAGRLDGVEIAVAPFTGLEPGGVLVLGDRRVTAEVVIDASGWRRVVAGALGAGPADRGHLSTGVETRHHHGGCDLEFWFRPPDRPDGVFWAFPAGDHVREGSASYVGKAKGLREDLARFEHGDCFPARAVHGGSFPSRLGEPVAGRTFVVGDAAGQCLPLTGEGIRPSLVFGQAAGREARAVLEGSRSVEEALARYRATVNRSRRTYAALERFQTWMVRLPVPVVSPMVRAAAWPAISRRLESIYWTVADPDTLEVSPGQCSTTSLTAGCCETGPAVARRRAGAAPSGPDLELPVEHGVGPWSSGCRCDARDERHSATSRTRPAAQAEGGEARRGPPPSTHRPGPCATDRPARAQPARKQPLTQLVGPFATRRRAPRLAPEASQTCCCR